MAHGSSEAESFRIPKQDLKPSEAIPGDDWERQERVLLELVLRIFSQPW